VEIRQPTLFGLFFAVALLSSGCTCRPSANGGAGARALRVASTTSLEASGLLGLIRQDFEQRTGIAVQAVAVGTGQALRLADSGDCDALLVHDREGELSLVAAGVLLERRVFARNDFVIAGPGSDPARIRGCGSATEALRRIAAQAAIFVSRGDDSGTHRLERRLWAAAGVHAGKDAYIEAGQGMAETLRMADEKRGYALCDRASFLVASQSLDLEILFGGDPALRNEYAALRVNPARHPHVREDAARRLQEFLLSPEGQERIASLKASGQALFQTVAHENR
jgi:tungstate transport system substrate-binding protein